MEDIVFFETMTQPKNNVYVLFIVLSVAIAFVLVLLIAIMLSIKNINISVKDREIIIDSLLYKRKIPIENVLIDEMKRINLKQNTEYNISYKRGGISLPNLHVGRMRLKNGAKALVYVTNKENVLLMPTKDFIVLFSMEKIEEFINKITERS